MNIEILGLGVVPKQIVDRAKDRMNELKKEKRDIEKQNVWCVFDRDVHESFFAAIVMAKANGFGVAFSNPSFELWYLLHFQDQNSHLERNDAISVLKSHIPGYAKNLEGLFTRLETLLPGAEGRAQQLRDKHIGDGHKETHNPSTGVDLLVAHLRNLISPKH